MSDLYLGDFSFDVFKPYFANEFPSNGSTYISIESNIGFDYLHVPGGEPDPYSLNVRLDGTLIIQNGAALSGYSVFLIPISNGYHVVIEPDDYLLENHTYSLQLDGEDINGHVADTYYFSFSTARMFMRNARCFLLNSKIKTITDQTSSFKPEILNTVAGSQGNVVLNITAPPVLLSELSGIGTPQFSSSYEIRTVRTGQLDPKLNAQIISEVELGTGQIKYSEETTRRGTFNPPGFIIDDNAGNVFGMDRTFSRHIFATDFVGYKAVNLIICDRNEESFFVFAHRNYYPVVDYQPKVYSIAKLGKIDSNPKSGIDIPIKTIDDAVKVSPNRYVCVTTLNYDTINYNPASIYFTILDDDLNIIHETGKLNPFAFMESSTAIPSAFGYYSASMYSDGKGAVYCAFQYTPNTSVEDSIKIYFMKSVDGGYNWDIVNSPGTSEPLSLPNPLQSELKYLPPENELYEGQKYPKLSYDEVNEYFLLTFFGHVSGGGASENRMVIMYSKDFINWSRYSYPIFYMPVANKSSRDYIGDSGTSQRLVRLGNQLLVVANTKYGQYISLFNHENEIFGLRDTMFWGGAVDFTNKGAAAKNFEYRMLDGILYVIANCYDQQGFVIHAVGGLTNLPDRTPYNHAYFGNFSPPSANYGYTQYSTGTPVMWPYADGYYMKVKVGDTLFYEYDTSVLTNDRVKNKGLKIKFIIYPSEDLNRDSAEVQRIYVKIPTTDLSDHIAFTIRAGNNGIRIENDATSSQYIYWNTSTFPGFVEVLVVCKPSLYSLDIKAFAKIYDPSLYKEVWQPFNSSGVFSPMGSVGSAYFAFGLKVAPTTNDSEAYWKAIYLGYELPTTSSYPFTSTTKMFDIEQSVNDGLLSYVAGSNDEMLEPISMNIEDTAQTLIDDFIARWRGLDSVAGDSWTFSIETAFDSSNILKKFPSIPYRTANTSIEHYIEFSAVTDNIGAFVFNTIVFMNLNCRYIQVKAKNNFPPWWSAPPFDQQFDLTFDTGTIAADCTRIDEDILTVRVSNKAYLQGELIDKYIMLERMFEPHNTTPAKDNSYRNVAFKIIDNGPDYIMISTKGLLKDELNTDTPTHNYAAMKVLSGENFLLYDTRLSFFTEQQERYTLVRIYIPASASYGTAWGNNQPSLPNERTWQIGQFDIGERIVLEDDVQYPDEEEIDLSIKKSEKEDGQINTDRTGRESRQFNLNYKLLNEMDVAKLESMFNSANEAGEPFWYIPNIVDAPEKLYMVYFLKDLTKIRNLPEYYDARFVLEEVT